MNRYAETLRQARAHVELSTGLDLRWKQCRGHTPSGNRCRYFVHLPADAPPELSHCERHKPKPTPIEETP